MYFQSLILLATAAGSLALSTLSVDTTVGTAHGLINGTHPNVAQFLGIPYAESPVGERRWERSVAISPIGDIDATRFSPSCPQYDTSIPSTYEIDARQFLISGPISEDCLTLSIWAPFSSVPFNQSLPVIVWLYGGGQVTGGAEIEYQIPTPWVQRTQAHIVVQINYRLNVFGNPKARGLSQTLNLGLLDQRLGIEWVRSNIANFGGDPSKITLWGQSAGAGSTDYYNFAYPDDPIVKGIILDSSSAFSYGDPTTDIGNDFTLLAGHFGCGNLTAADELACMKKVDFLEIEGFLKAYQDAGTTPSIRFGPIVDGVTLFENYTERYLLGQFSRVPAIHGTNNNEGTSLTAWVNNGTTYNETAAYASTVQRACASQKTLKFVPPPNAGMILTNYFASLPSHRYDANTTSFHYYYTGDFHTISPRPWQGAYHSSELPMLFGTHDIVRGPSTPFSIAVSHRMQDLWLAFMRDPYNGLPDQGWPVFTPGGQGIEFAYNNTVDRLISVESFREICDDEWKPKPGAVPVDHTGPGGVE